METQKHLSLRDYARVVRKRWKVVLGFAVLGLIIGIVQYVTATPAYESSSQVLIDKPSGYVITSAVGALGSATSTQQQIQFIETESYQDLSRALAEIAPHIHLDLQDQSLLDDIDAVIESDVLNSDVVTPVRLVLYRQPAVNLLSFQQTEILKQTPKLGRNLVMLARMAIGPEYDLYNGWERGRPGSSDRHVWDNLQTVAASPLVQSLQSLGVSDATAAAAVTISNAQDRENLVVGKRLQLAARTVGILNTLDEAAGTAKDRGRKISEMTSGDEVFRASGEIMQSSFVQGLRDGPGVLDWDSLSPRERHDALLNASEAYGTYRRKSPPKKEAAWKVTGDEPEEMSGIIAINQTAGSPSESRAGANAMAAILVWKDRMTRVADAERSVRFLQAQLGSERSGATRALYEAEDKLTAFRKRNRLLDVDTTMKLAVERAADLEQQRGEAEAGVREVTASLAKTNQQLRGVDKFTMSPTIRQNPLIESVKSGLIRVETELANLRGKDFTDEWPAVKALEAEKAALMRELEEQMRTPQDVTEQYASDPIYLALTQRADELAAKQVGLEARRTAVTRILNDLDGMFTNLPDKQADMVRLMRAYALSERQYNELNARLVDARNKQAMGQGNARVVQPAVDPGKRVSPRLRSVIFAVVLGMMFGALCALVLSSSDTHLRTAEDVRRELNLPVLAHLPAIPDSAALVVETMPAAAVTEGFRALRSTIRFLGTDKPIQTLAATSTKLGEGKSTVVANLAASLAQAGLTVTAVDGDMRRPRLSTFFGVPSSGSLVSALEGARPARQARQATRIPGLYMVPAGTTASPGELLDNGRIERVMEELREDNDMVILDTPPIGVVSDAALIGSAADATILVMESGSVEPAEARAAVDRLITNARANVIGVVLIGGDAPISEDYVRYVSASRGDGNGTGHGAAGRARDRQTHA